MESNNSRKNYATSEIQTYVPEVYGSPALYHLGNVAMLRREHRARLDLNLKRMRQG